MLLGQDRKERMMASLAPMQEARRPAPMSNVSRLDADSAWNAFERRDRSWDGRVIGAVTTTGIYCKPSCPARRPKREHVEFFASGAEARAAGYRACLRCKPDEVGRDREAVAKAVRQIERAEEAPSLAELAAAVGYAPHHFQRIFKRDLGVSPAEYARGLRMKRAQGALKENGRVTDAIYEAGYAGPSSFYSDAKERLGMTPSAWRDGGRGETIRWTHFDSPIGQMLIAATSKGICRLTFDDSPQSLRRLFPNATIVEDAGGLRELVEGALVAIERPLAARELPIDVAGTAFQEAVWRELRKIPPGETRSYADIAVAIGQPKAVRAVGTANGDNHVAVLIPCHRVIRSDGSLGGYAGGLERKRKLLAAESAASQLL
jgi:AraC family transcriptional regulator of adaptative response/methylated-DNA-[protein]-cysteine methyltransferase